MFIWFKIILSYNNIALSFYNTLIINILIIYSFIAYVINNQYFAPLRLCVLFKFNELLL